VVLTVGLEMLGSALKAGVAAKPAVTRWLNGKTAAEDGALRSLIRESLSAAIAEQGGPQPIAEVLFRPFQDKGTLQRLVGHGQVGHGLTGAEQAWSALLSHEIAQQDGVDLDGLDVPLLCTTFARTLWQGIQDEASRHESPLANLANRLQLAELMLGARAEGSEVSAEGPSGLQVALPKRIFVGRDADMLELDGRVERDSAVVVTGPPGVGKSELAAQWAAGQPADSRWWIDASSVSSFRAGINELAVALGIDRWPNLEQTLSAVLGAEGICLVLDDAIPEVVAATLSNDVASRVVVTSVSAPLEHSDVVLELEPLGRDSLRALAKVLLPRLTDAEAETLVDLFPGQPLGIRQATPKVDLMGLDRLVRILEESSAAGQRMGSVAGGRENMAALWEHSLGRSHGDADSGGRRALSLLHVLGGFAAPLDIFLGSVAVELAGDGELLADETECWRLVGTCRDLRLVDLESGWVRAHGLLRDYCWDTLGEDQRRHAVASVTTALTEALSYVRQDGGPQGLLLLDFVWNVTQLVDPTQPAPEHYVSMLGWSVDVAMLHGQREPCLTLVDQALWAATQGDDQELVSELVNLKLHTLESLASPQSLPLIDEYASVVVGSPSAKVRCVFHCNAARALLRFDEADRARDHAAAALDAAKAVGTGAEQDQLLVMAHRAIAIVEAWHGDVDLADDHLRRSSELAATVDDGGQAGFEIAKAAAALFTRLGHVQKAGAWRNRLLSLVDSCPPAAKYEVAVVLGEAGRLPDALKLLESYVGELDVFDNESSTLRRAEALNTAGRLCLDHFEVDDAKPYLERAHDLLSRVEHLESSVPHRADVLDNLANCAMADGDFVRGAKLAVQALKLDAAYYGRDHHEYASGLTTLAYAQFLAGLLESALQRLRQAIAIWERPGASQHLHLLSEARQIEAQWVLLLGPGADGP
jgi:tetratricopeptide (TPR) repeat protein